MSGASLGKEQDDQAIEVAGLLEKILLELEKIVKHLEIVTDEENINGDC